MSIRALNWVMYATRDRDVPSGVFTCLMVLAWHHHDKTNECFPAYATIAKEMHVTRRQAINCVKKAEELGLIDVFVRRVNGRQGSNGFRLFGKFKGEESPVVEPAQSEINQYPDRVSFCSPCDITARVNAEGSYREESILGEIARDERACAKISKPARAN